MNATLFVSELSKKTINILSISSSPLLTNDIVFKDNKHYKIVPEMDCKLGFGFESNPWGFLLRAEAGFTAMMFFNAQQTYHFNDFNTGEADLLSNIGLHGLYVSGSIYF